MFWSKSILPGYQDQKTVYCFAEQLLKPVNNYTVAFQYNPADLMLLFCKVVYLNEFQNCIYFILHSVFHQTF